MNAVKPDLIVFDRKLLEERDYWLERLSKLDDAGALRTDSPRPSRRPYGAKEVFDFAIDGELYQKLNRVTGGSPFLLYTALTAALTVCLRRYTGGGAVVVGSPARRSASAAPANALAVVNFVDEQKPFREFLLEVRGNLLEAYARQRYPFARLLEDLGLGEVENRCPLFDVALRLEGLHGELPAVGNDITLDFAAEEGRVGGAAAFDAALYRRETIERLCGHLRNVLGAALESPASPLARLQLTDEAERRLLVSDWNDTAADFEDGARVHELFERHARERADSPALVCGGETLSYAELNGRANQLARHLHALGVGPETLVGICAARSAEMVVALLAVFKAGGAYLPLDPAYPRERLELMIEDSRVSVLLTQESLLPALPDCDAALVCLDACWPVVAAESEEDFDGGATADNLAYVIYTSGSTGVPKGVMVAHRGLCNLSAAQSRAFGLRPGARVLQFSSLNFDASIFEIVMALCAGSALYVEPVERLLPGPGLVGLLREQEITNLTIPPSVLATLPASELPSLRTLVVAGEACSSELVETWAPGRRFFNAYGPTETTVWASVAECRAGGGEPSIGRPIQNARVYVLDPAMNPQPAGAAGEIHIGGAGLARGYLNRPGLTAERFIPDPFSNEPGARLYKTGDAARLRACGEIEFAGRIDQQVKVRGFRIEPGEIEAVLRQHPSVRDAAVEAREDAPGNRRLVAYVVAAGGVVSNGELREYLLAKLPEYMVPSAFVTLGELPLTPNGKVDRRALPAPEHERPELAVSYAAPRNEIEETVARAWSEILGVERVGINDNFFELGGHSLLATQTLSRVSEAFRVEVPLNRLFEEPTVAGLAAAVAERLGQQDAGELLSIEKVDRAGRPALAESVEQLPGEQVELLLKSLLGEKGAEL